MLYPTKPSNSNHVVSASMFPIPSQLSAIPWADIYRSPTSFFVDSVIPAGSPPMDRIEHMKCSSMIKLADRIRLVQQSDRPSIFRAKADILRILRPLSEAAAPKTRNKGVSIIDVDAVLSAPAPPQFDSSGEFPSIAPESPLTLVRTLAIESSIIPGSNTKRKSETSFAENAGASDGTRSPKKSRLSGAFNCLAPTNTTPKP